ncbi:MAG: hypothetical protein WC214_02590 [Candidatus Omnitrophota bacterium]|nr:hypothetical protein [Candidatus Omnitrophota bacterium]
MLSINKLNIFIGLLSFFSGLVFSNNVYALDNQKVCYKINKFGVKVGTAVLESLGRVEYQGKKYALIVFTARAVGFFDEEKIYMDIETLYPVVVTRDINIFGKKEKIDEFYGPDGKIKIINRSKGKETETTFQTSGRADNIYCFIQRLSNLRKIAQDDIFELNLPTRKVSAVVKGKDEVNIDGFLKSAYLIETVPKQFKIWLSDDGAMLPLRIDGTVGLRSAVMIMTDSCKSDKN